MAILVQVCTMLWPVLGSLLIVTASPCMSNTRFIAAKRGAKVSLICSSDSPAFWHKETSEGKFQKMTNTSRVFVTSNASMVVMKIRKVQETDNGVYFCLCNSTMLNKHCGTELKVLGVSTFDQVQSRHTLKDAIIFIETLLLVLFTSIPLFMTMGKGNSSAVSTEDHTYEGLAVELADTYEDIGNYQDKAEKWDSKEHPNKE